MSIVGFIVSSRVRLLQKNESGAAMFKNVETLAQDETSVNWTQNRALGPYIIQEAQERVIYSGTGMPIWYHVDVDVQIQCCVQHNDYTYCNEADQDSRCPS